MAIIMTIIMTALGQPESEPQEPVEPQKKEEIGDTSEYPNPRNPYDWDSLQMYEPLDSLDKRS